MKKLYQIGIWGQFGDGVNKIADGQAVRTTIITEELKARYGEENIMVVNTNNWRKHPLRFLLRTLRLNAKCRKVVIFPADNGFKVGVPILNFSNAFYRRELYDVVIGGYLPDLLKRKPVYLKMLKKYRALFVQTPNLQTDLEAFGLDKIYILSNLKRLNCVKAEETAVNRDPQVKVCTMCRVTETKGIAYAVDAVKAANEALGGSFIHLDIYGIVAPEYRETFDGLLAAHGDFVTYGGVVDFDKTADTLRNYFLMLFPTYYYGEGFPGNVVDAYNAALPMVATDWNYNSDVIHDGENGILVPIKDVEALRDGILALYRDRERAHEIALNNIRAAQEYTPDRVLAKFYEFMD
ncbi:MAG: glycosyltransferase family 4 protein [Clostridia bacterium]|nr:glycosyltransferase family 4 protein [Clostridia bacterium]